MKYKSKTETIHGNVKRNPPSHGFDYIGSGCFASAYKHDDRVELIVKVSKDFLDTGEAIKHGGIIDSNCLFPVVDMSREAMIRAREVAPSRLKKFLPEITRLRIDTDKHGNVEFVYGMPLYERWSYGDCKKYNYPNQREFKDLEDIIWKSAAAIYRGSKYSTKLKYSYEEGAPMAKIDGGELSNLSEQNEGIAKDWTIILRDPLVCLFFPQDAVRLFAKKFK
jgi:hypothetical protein